ncbi:MAG: hypothetical protein IKB09_02635 [Oscillospiraceae bacterium]|nr:hypothetical protein [Oscillospiraceae bacterium]
MDMFIEFIAAALVLAYGGLGIWLLLRQRSCGNVLLTGGGLLLAGGFLYQFLFVAAEMIAWVLVIALVLYIIGSCAG